MAMKDRKKFKDERTISKEFNAKISKKEIENIIEEIPVDNIKQTHEVIEKSHFYYIMRVDYKNYKKGEIVCNKEDIDKFTQDELQKVIVIKNK